MKKKTSKRTSGTGSIVYRNGKWVAQVSKYDPDTGETLYTPNGNAVRLSRSFDSKAEAERFLADYQQKRYNLKPFVSSDMPLQEWLEQWLEDYKHSGVKQSTIDTADNIIRNHLIPNFGKAKLNQLTAFQIKKMYNSYSNTLSAKSIKNIHWILSMSLAEAVRYSLLIENPCARVKLPRCNKFEAKPLTPSERQLLVKEVRQFRDVYDFIVYFVLFTGLRQGEALGLTWDRVNLLTGEITIDRQLTRTTHYKNSKLELKPTKTNNSRTFLLATSLVDILNKRKLQQIEYADMFGNNQVIEKNLIFTLPNGNHISASSLHKHFKRIVTKIGRPDLRFHDLRHTYATMAAEKGLPPSTLAKILGHSTSAVTMQYYIHKTTEGDVTNANITERLIKEAVS